MSDPAERPTSKRLVAFEKMTAGGKGDTLTWYGLAMEYRSLGLQADAEQAFTTLRERDPAYVPMYYQAAAMLLEAGRKADARVWIDQGIERARQKGDGHALGELEQLRNAAAGQDSSDGSDA